MYKIMCWIPIEDSDENPAFENRKDAELELEHCEYLQPENKYEIVEF